MEQNPPTSRGLDAPAGSPDAITTSSARESVVEARSLVLAYGQREVVRDLDLEIPKGQFLVVVGPSGSGKTTLLLSLNGSVPARTGSLNVLGEDPSRLHGSALERFRGRIGFIFQSFHLVGRAEVLHNVASGMLSRIPMARALLRWYTPQEYATIFQALSVVGLQDRILDRCDRLSGGQKQRIAIARAIVQRPDLILADEPISALDPRSAERVMETLRRATTEFGISVVCSLHNLGVARRYADRILGLNEGRVVFDGPPEHLGVAEETAIYRGAQDRDDPGEDDPGTDVPPSRAAA